MKKLMVGITVALLLIAASAFSQPTAKTFTWDPVTQADDDSVLPVGRQVFEYAVGCAHTLAEYQAAEGHSNLYVYTEVVQAAAQTVTHTFNPGDYVCGVYAHNVDGWSASSNTVSFTVTTAPVPVPRHPKLPGHFQVK
jgi:uncharacterized protein YxeA